MRCSGTKYFKQPKKFLLQTIASYFQEKILRTFERSRELDIGIDFYELFRLKSNKQFIEFTIQKTRNGCKSISFLRFRR